MSIANPETKSIHALLSEDDAQYHVPAYQREYSWQNIQLDDLWEDLLEAMNHDLDEHFFGQIVTNTSVDGFDIIDGQQRMTTSVLLLAAMRDALEPFIKSTQMTEDERYNARRRFDTINEQYLESAVNSGRAVLTLPKENNKIAEYFEQIVLKGIVNEADNKTANNLSNAYWFFSKKIKQYISKKDDKNLGVADQFDRLDSLIRVFTKKFKVILINTANSKDGFVIFETLNARGKSLEEADLLKNLLMGFLVENSSDASAKWEKVFDTLDRDSSRTSRFIRAYWAFNEALVNKDKLFRTMRKSSNLKNAEDAERILADLAQLVDIYNAMDKGRKSQFEDKDLGDLISVAASLVSTYHPVILAMYDRKYGEKDVKIVLNKILGVYALNIFILGEVANDLEKDLVKVAQKIKKGEVSGVSAIVDSLNSLQKKKKAAEFLQVWTRDKWTINTSRNTNQSQTYLLSEFLATQETGKKSSAEITAYDLFKKYRLIRLFTEDQLGSDRDFANRMGNFTLIEKSIDWDELASSDDKAKLLKKSMVLGTEKLSEMIDGWNGEKIKNRSLYFGSLVSSIW